MSRVNEIQNAIKELDGGEFHKLFDAYLYKKYNFKNIHTLGVQEGTNKTTKGTPDSYVDDNGQYILIMYGTVKDAYKKIKSDILSCFDKAKLNIKDHEIKEIICAYSSTNLHPEQLKELKKLVPNVIIELIGLDTISYDLGIHYPNLAWDYLNIPIDTHQIFTIEEFIKTYDHQGTSAPLAMSFHCREQEKEQLYQQICSSEVTLVLGAAGVGKTKLVLEVCKMFAQEDRTVLCVKNNGLILYDDLHFYIDHKGKYILFIDDVNQMTDLKSTLDYISCLPDDFDIKIVMTVRDYAKSKIYDTVCKYQQPGEITIGILKDDEIKEILEEDFDIVNEDYLNKILKIAKGNIRLAILAGEIAIDKGLSAIKCTLDIFSQYYGEVIHNAGLTELEVNTLFIVSLLGMIRYKESTIAKDIAELMNIDSEQFCHSCHILNDKELIDLYQDTVAKVSDQSLGNYVLYYILIEKKTITIYQLLQLGFPDYKEQLVFAINTLIRLYNSDDIVGYIEDQVNKSWNKAEKNGQEEYLKCFFALNEEKTLGIINQLIKSTERIEKEITISDLEKGKNYVNIKNDEIAILSKFKYSKYYTEVVEMLVEYYEKRPDLVLDFYVAFTDELSYDKDSYKCNYNKELEVVNCLWEHSNHGQNTNVTILMLYIFRQLLKCNFQKVESGDNNKTIYIYDLCIGYTTGSKQIRHDIWKALSEIYSIDIYTKTISNIISDNYVSWMGQDVAKKFFSYDLQCIKEGFFDKWERLTFEQCKILDKLKKQAKKLDDTILESNKELFKRYVENKDFVIYNTLTMDGIYQKGNEVQRKDKIIKMIQNYKLEDFKYLFKLCSRCEIDNDEQGWSLRSGLEVIFSSLQNESDFYYNVIDEYLKCQAPYGSNPDTIIKTLIENYGFEKTEAIIKDKDFPLKHKWLSVVWENTPTEIIDATLTEEFLQFVKEESQEEDPYYTDIICLNKFKTYDEDIVKKVSKIIIENPKNDYMCVAKFLNNATEKSIDLIIDLYSNEQLLLEKLYLLAMQDYFDFEGKLIMKIIDNHASFWNTYTKKLPEIMNLKTNEFSYEHNVFNNIWMRDDYDKFIQIAYKNMIGDYFNIESEQTAKVIFSNDKNTPEVIIYRKKQWIKNYIKQNHEETENIKMIFEIIVTFFESDRNEFILDLLENTKDISVFKSISLFPHSETWTKSAVPLIDEKIKFLDCLISSIKGVEFIEHRAYLKGLKETYKGYRQEILLQEYIGSGNIA